MGCRAGLEPQEALDPPGQDEAQRFVLPQNQAMSHNYPGLRDHKPPTPLKLQLQRLYVESQKLVL